MLKLISKFVLNIFPSVAASVIGAYIVQNYIYARPAGPAPAVTVSKAGPAGIDGALFAMPVPVDARAVETKALLASPQRPALAVTVESAAAGDGRPEAAPSRNVHGPARAAAERLGVARRGGPSGMLVSQRERVPARGAASSPAAPVLMPALALVPDPRGAESPASPRIDTASASTGADPVRIMPRVAEIALIKRLSALSTDVETMLVSQTRSAADGVVTTAKSVFHAMLPR